MGQTPTSKSMESSKKALGLLKELDLENDSTDRLLKHGSEAARHVHVAVNQLLLDTSAPSLAKKPDSKEAYDTLMDVKARLEKLHDYIEDNRGEDLELRNK